MLISHEQLRDINNVQINILKSISDVCKQLDIKFFMVHGSLLGTVKGNKFIPDDDDIDVAFFRKDYEKFAKEAPKLLEKHYFVQTPFTDVNYPLAFGKLRDSRTTYIIENASHLQMNHGIYVDIFPIDNCHSGGLKAKLFEIMYKLLDMRIASVYDLSGESFLKKAVRLCTKIIIPSYDCAIKKRKKMLTHCHFSGYVRVSGGKTAEQCIPIKWFEKAVPDVFEGVDVFVPCEYDKYLTRIYGDYKTRTLVEDKVCNEENIEINACAVSISIPYVDYYR
ncbi:MAG: LicD family protein [Clostridia bacterium]|nr:LicD family protein [Clostridia bacterium]